MAQVIETGTDQRVLGPRQNVTVRYILIAVWAAVLALSAIEFDACRVMHEDMNKAGLPGVIQVQ